MKQFKLSFPEKKYMYSAVLLNQAGSINSEILLIQTVITVPAEPIVFTLYN